MTIPLNSQSPEDDLPDESPEVLSGIAQRMQKAIEELFAVKAEAEELSKSAKLPEEVERVLTAASHPETEHPAMENLEANSESLDRRLYLPLTDGWEFHVKSGPREYCYYRNPDEEWFHLLIDGELYLQFGSEKICLNCAVRHGILTDNRLFWQTGRRHRTHRIDTDVGTESALENPTEK